jgi:hypothetical protein
VATVLYFAYGANLHPLRLRTVVPSCEFVATAVLGDHGLRFHKRSRDGSAKCDAFPEPGAAVHGAVYRLDAAERPALDRSEEGYDGVDVTLRLAAGTCTAFTYRAQPDFVDPGLRPYDWYRDVVCLGARHRRLPQAWVAMLEAIPAAPDPNAERAARGAALLARLRAARG